MFILVPTPDWWGTRKRWPYITEVEKAMIGLIHDSENSE